VWNPATASDGVEDTAAKKMGKSAVTITGAPRGHSFARSSLRTAIQPPHESERRNDSNAHETNSRLPRFERPAGQAAAGIEVRRTALRVKPSVIVILPSVNMTERAIGHEFIIDVTVGLNACPNQIVSKQFDNLSSSIAPED
jgi:hypothetical protein